MLNSYVLWRKCIGICLINHPTTISEICRKIKDSRTNPNFHKLIKFLAMENYISIDKDVIPHMITIDNKKLGWFLREGEPFFKSENLIKITMGLKPYYYG